MQEIEEFNITDGTNLLQATNLNGRGIIIIGGGNVTVICARAADAHEMRGKAEIISAELEREIRRERMREEAEEWIMAQGAHETFYEFVCNNLVHEMEVLKTALLNCDRISHHPRFMQRVAINYRSPALRPAIVRRGSRQSKRGDPS